MRFRVGINSAVAPPDSLHLLNMHRIWISPVPAFKRLFRPSKPFRVLYTRLWWTWATVHFERWYLLKQLVDCCFLFKVPGPRFQTPFSPFKTISRLIHDLCWTWATKFISKNIFARTPFLSPPVPALNAFFALQNHFVTYTRRFQLNLGNKIHVEKWYVL